MGMNSTLPSEKKPISKDTLTGYVERVSFHNEENGFTILQLKCPKMADCITVVGTIPSVKQGETLNCEGFWKQHPVYGRQFEISSCQVAAPSDLIGIKKYLCSGLIKGIGHVYAERITNKFGIETLEVIDKHPERLKEVDGLGPKRIDAIISSWSGQKTVREAMIFLQGHGVTPAFAQKLFKTYGPSCIETVKNNPYRLARDIFGIGFKTADQIAVKMGILHDAVVRIEAGIEYALRELSEEGHVCYPEELFIPKAAEMLGVSKELIETSLETLTNSQRIEKFPLVFKGEIKPFLWFKPFFNAEVGIAREIDRIKHAPCGLRMVDLDKALNWVQEKIGLELAPAQQEAVKSSLVLKLQIITGGPGTGKSTITKAILRISEKLTDKILLAAPTGRAAKRMSEITGRKAQTLHSLLEVNFQAGGFKRGKENPLDVDLLIVDESSMIDTHLMFSLLKAVPSSARLIFVGDVNQLPSVGPGNVLNDMIESLQVPVTTLTEIYRQAQGSEIIVNAHRIHHGQFPNIDPKPGSDFFFAEANEPEEVMAQVLKLVAQRVPAKYGFHPIQDIQVLAPMRKGVVGIDNLNAVLQEHLNPYPEPLFKSGRRYHPGDKVMQIRNNYQKEVFNGDVGRIVSIDSTAEELIVRFDDREVPYEFSDLDELVLAYAVSVHKFQGSECPCVIIPVHTTHFKLLHRNLLYTAVTRGKKLVILVGSKKALALAVHNNEIKERYTGLKQALLGTIGKGPI